MMEDFWQHFEELHPTRILPHNSCLESPGTRSWRSDVLPVAFAPVEG